MEISLGQRPSLVDAVPDSDAVGSDDPVDRGPFDAVFPIVAMDRISNSFGQQNQQDIIIRRPKIMATSFTHSLALAHRSRRNQPWHQITVVCGLDSTTLTPPFFPFFFFFLFSLFSVCVCMCVCVCVCMTRPGYFPYTQAAANWFCSVAGAPKSEPLPALQLSPASRQLQNFFISL